MLTNLAQRKSTRLAEKAESRMGKGTIQIAQDLLIKKLGDLSHETKCQEPRGLMGRLNGKEVGWVVLGPWKQVMIQICPHHLQEGASKDQNSKNGGIQASAGAYVMLSCSLGRSVFSL